MLINSILAGSIGVLFAACLTIFLAKKSTNISDILIFAFLVRALAVIIHTYLYPLPVAIHDAVRFEAAAWSLTQLTNGSLSDFFSLYVDILNQEAPKAYSVLRDLSWTYVPFYSLFYVLFDRSPFLLNSLSISIGLMTVYFGWLIALKLWEDAAAARKSAIVMAFFPPLIMYSSVVLREIFIILFIQLFVIYFLQWQHEGKRLSFIGSIISALTHLILHNPMFFVLASSYLYPLFSFTKNIFNKSWTLSFTLILIVMTCIVMFLYITDYTSYLWDLPIPYLGPLKNFGLSNIIAYTQNTNYGNAVYPAFVVLNNYSDIITLLPVRVAYFLYSPFLWDVKSLPHILGIFDALFYYYLTYLFFSRYKEIQTNKKLIIIFFVLVIGVLIYSFGVGNFANAMRHRVKFLTLMVLVVAPFIFTKKIKERKND
jgi:hypothetical protein